MNKLEGIYFDGRHPLGSAATLFWLDQQANLVGGQVLARFPTQSVKVSPRVGGADRFVILPDGTQLQCKDTALLDALPDESPSEGPVAWLERRWPLALLGVVIVVALLAFAYLFGLPRLAEFGARRIPIESEQQLGATSLEWLDKNHWFTPSRMPAPMQQSLSHDFAALTLGLPQQAHYRLVFRAAPRIGANAMALPGGTIVITDELLEQSRSPEEVLAVLAHEAGHVEMRHAMRHVLQNLGVAAVVTALTGDAASMGTAVAGVPTLLAQASYSREFETEADEFAFALLKRHRISPARFADLMERLEQNRKGRKLAPDFLASHPATPERIQRARDASADFDFSREAPHASASYWPIGASGVASESTGGADVETAPAE